MLPTLLPYGLTVSGEWANIVRIRISFYRSRTLGSSHFFFNLAVPS